MTASSTLMVEKAAEFQFTKALLDKVLDPVQGDLAQLNARLKEYIPVTARAGVEIIDHVFGAGGKRLRPALFFFSARLAGYRGEYLMPIAAVCEFVHTASLLHDDVVDNSTLRRNKPTANSIWGDQSSVLVGDLIYARASELMAETGNLELVKCFSRAIRLMSEGEVYQLEQVFNPNIAQEDYLRILNYKTGYLISACCKTAALLAQSSDEEGSALEEYGAAVGMAFQLVDDALDYMGGSAVVGKDTQADLKEGKITLPLILLRDRLPSKERDWFRQVVESQRLEREDLRKVTELIRAHKTVEDTLALAREHTEYAVKALSAFPDSKERRDLECVAESLLIRAF